MKLSTLGQREAIRQFQAGMAQATQNYQELESRYAAQLTREKNDYSHDQQRLGDEFQREHDQLHSEYLTQLETARVRYESAVELVAQQEQKGLSELELTCQALLSKSDSESERLKAQQASVYEEGQRKRKQQYRELLARCEQYKQELSGLVAQADDWMRRRGTARRFAELRNSGSWVESRDASPTARPLTGSETLLTECSRVATLAAQQLTTLRAWKVCRFADEGWPILVGIFTCLVVAYPAIVVWSWMTGALASLGIACVVGIASYFAAQSSARLAIRSHLPLLADTLDQAERSLGKARVEAQAEARADLTQMHRQHDEALARIEAEHQRTLQEVQRRRHDESNRLIAAAESQRQKLQSTWDGEANPIRQRYLPLLESRQTQYEQTLEKRLTHHQEQLAELKQQYDTAWRALTTQWQACWDHWLGALETMQAFQATHFPAWQAWDSMPVATEHVPDAIACGVQACRLPQLCGPLPIDSRLPLRREQFSLPVLLGLPDEASLLLQAQGDGRTDAIAVLRNVLLRFIAALPAGKFRLTIIDPTGLGQNFSELMHLTDFDERLVRSRIWTEPNHIQQRLVDLTEHMENVIQKYLRNDYSSIQAYNERAGEVAEPFQILAIANFPAAFTEEAAQRLIRIVGTGARCGVYTLLSTDMQLELPRNFDLSDLQRNCNALAWDESQRQFAWLDATLRPMQVKFEAPPDGEQINGIVRRVGQAAVEGQRVEVPFRKVMPAGPWWQEDCSDQLEIPIGRVGATRFQHLTLGRGTSQHVLLAGKTGSGKSTLLHAMITNAALHYSPAQLQFYLIDFKKGVEFKPYARYRLPHARVIAIESEREFGLSVLERLDAELRARGDRYREHGVQDLAAFRRACPDVPTPRILLVIDEFQEFFVKEDKIAQSAALLLDRLVRQGRAFGIHVLLGSQTLSGAYSLARSTIGQMAVRIALQCSETDAHMILSEDNDAARLLSRPGQAIYNDANGLFEGNHPFQVVWLPDEERRELLQELQAHAQRAPGGADQVPLVFEGNVAADPRDNRPWIRTLEGPEPHDTPLAPQAWLGAPIAIGPPPAASFRRQSGQNLLLVGPQADLAVATLSQAMLSLMAFSPRTVERDDRFQFCLLSPGDDPTQGTLWTQLAERFPEWVELYAATALGEMLDQATALLDRRMAHGQDRAAARFLVIPRLARFRDLQLAEHDLGFSSFSKEAVATPAQRLQRLVKDGPAMGVHTLIWCDQLADFHRWLGRGMLQEFHHRLLFPMNAADSSQLIDSPEASRLGALRAIYYRSDIGVSEKLRPHQMPNSDWLEQVARSILPTNTRLT